MLACEGPACCELTPSETGGGGCGDPAVETPEVARTAAIAPTMHARSRLIAAAPRARRRSARSCRCAAARMLRARSIQPRDQVAGRSARLAALVGGQRRQRSLSYTRGRVAARRRVADLTTGARERRVPVGWPRQT